MPRKPRQIESFSFRPDELTPVTDRMAQLANAGDGWINMVPRMSQEDDDKPTSLGFMTLFGGGSAGVTMCTWIPGAKDHNSTTQASLGITHVTGHRAVSELAARSTAVPRTWIVEQDHPFRGLVMRIPLEESNEQVLAWALRAVRALGTPRPIRGWRADVYLPLAG
jgi:hypothetical protein